MKKAKMLWLHDPNQSNVDNLNSVRCEASRHFRNKKEYLKAIIDDSIEKYCRARQATDDNMAHVHCMLDT
jgi:hypothetical protein